MHKHGSLIIRTNMYISYTKTKTIKCITGLCILQWEKSTIVFIPKTNTIKTRHHNFIVMGHFEQNKRIFILIVNPISSCLTYVNGIGNGYRIKFNCQLYPSRANQNAHAWPIYQFHLHSLNLNPCLSQKSTIKDTIMQKLYCRKLNHQGNSFSLILKLNHMLYKHDIEDHSDTICWKKSGFVSHTKHTAEATNTDLLHSWKITCNLEF